MRKFCHALHRLIASLATKNVDYCRMRSTVKALRSMYTYHFSVVLYCTHQHNDNYDCQTSFLSTPDCKRQKYKSAKCHWQLRCSLSHQIHPNNAVHHHTYDMTHKKTVVDCTQIQKRHIQMLIQFT